MPNFYHLLMIDDAIRCSCQILNFDCCCRLTFSYCRLTQKLKLSAGGSYLFIHKFRTRQTYYLIYKNLLLQSIQDLLVFLNFNLRSNIGNISTHTSHSDHNDQKSLKSSYPCYPCKDCQIISLIIIYVPQFFAY